MIASAPNRAAFSLVEVVLALAIFVFAGFALISLLSVGIQANHNSKEQLQAANIVEFLCSTRRAAPTASLTTSEPNFPLPILSTTADNLSSPAYLTWDGLATNAANASFGLLYSIQAPANYTAKTNPGYARVYLCLYWPAQAPLNATAGRFELESTFALP